MPKLATNHFRKLKNDYNPKVRVVGLYNLMFKQFHAYEI